MAITTVAGFWSDQATKAQTGVKDAQTAGRVNEDQGQRITRSVAKAIETLFRSGAYLDDMDEIEVRITCASGPSG